MRLSIGCLCLLSLAGCYGSNETPEGKGESTSNIVVIEGEGRLSVTVSVTKGTDGVAAHVSTLCGPVTDRKDLAGDGDKEGILFPIIRPENCVITVTVASTDATKPDTKIELRQPGKAQSDTVLNGEGGGYTVVATFAEPVR